jgi:glycosyltransferase involved in cell wall biosynthesis
MAIESLFLSGINNMAVDELGGIVLTRLGPRRQEIFASTVAIPAKNEAERLPHCIKSLISQTGIDFSHLGVILLLNNCTDHSRDAVAALASRLPFELIIGEVHLPAARAHAGWARRLAMALASDMTSSGGFIATTDADCIVDPDWLITTRRELERPVDAVAGFVTADWSELSALPQPVLDQGALEWEYQGLSAELEAKVDPMPHDPWPRHNQNCGASLAITKAMFDNIGGVPPIAVGEDRAVMDFVRHAEGKIRHSMEVHVTASARTVGRAAGGMADALRARGSNDYYCDDILEPAVDALRRFTVRRAARAAWSEGKWNDWSGAVPRGSFGLSWDEFEARCPNLNRKILRSGDLPVELTQIKKFIAALGR